MARARPGIEREIRKAARRYDIDPAIFRRQLVQESGLNENAVSPMGARGIAQFMPATAPGYGVNLNDGRVSDDIDGAARYLRDGLRRYGGDYRKALAAYNAGFGAVDKYGGVPPYAETQKYVQIILGDRAPKATPSSGAHVHSEGEPQSEPSTRTETRTDFDRAGFQDAQRRALLSQILLRRNPNSSLARFGLLDSTEPAREDYTTQRQVQVPERRTNATQGGDMPRPGKLPGPLGGTLNEMFLNVPGAVNVDNGKRVPMGFVDGHDGHLHIAAGKRSIQTIAKLAQAVGLNVRELAPFDKVDPVHAPGSFHDDNRAVDLSGDRRKLVRFSRRIANLYKV